MSRPIRASPSRSGGIVCVCSSRTICRRCSTMRRERRKPRRARRAPPRRSSLSRRACASISRVPVPRSSGRARRRSAAASARRTRSRGCRRGPRLMSWPSTRTDPCPRCACTCRLIEWMSAIAAKSRYLRQMNGRDLADEGLARRDVAGDGARLDQGGALPVLSHALVVEERRRRRRARRGVAAGSGRSRRSMRKT